jgi:hypothetical protein
MGKFNCRSIQQMALAVAPRELNQYEKATSKRLESTYISSQNRTILGFFKHSPFSVIEVIIVEVMHKSLPVIKLANIKRSRFSRDRCLE